MQAIQPWGIAPTPLLPAPLLQALGHLPAPGSLVQSLGLATLAEVGPSLWTQVDAIPHECPAEVAKIIQPYIAECSHLPLRTGQNLRRPISELPFSPRIRNRVQHLREELSAEYLTLDDVLLALFHDARSALEFSCVLEAAMLDKPAPRKISQPKLAPAHAVPSTLGRVFQALSAYACGEQCLATLDEVLPAPLVSWPPEIQKLWTQMSSFGSREIAGDVLKHYAVPFLLADVFKRFSQREWDLMAARVFTLLPAPTLAALGRQHGITRERVRQLEKESRNRLEVCKAALWFQPVMRRAQALRARLGVGLPYGHALLEEALQWATRDFTDPWDREGTMIQLSSGWMTVCEQTGQVRPANLETVARSLLLWLAGPYKEQQGWLMAEPKLPELTVHALRERADHRGCITDEAITETLQELGIQACVHAAWMARMKEFQSVEGGFIYFRGSILEKAYALLRYREKPMTVEALLEEIGQGSVRSVRQRLMGDPRFWRVNVQGEFVIAHTPGYDEYTGIVEEIMQELDACGGTAPFPHLVERIVRQYGVKEGSVVAYLNTPMFIRDEMGMVRVRGDDEHLVVTNDITKAAGCYQNRNGIWQWRIRIDKDMERGSGRAMPNAFAQLLGCRAGDRIAVPSAYGPIALSWPLWSNAGASIGSLRAVLAEYGARIGDYLFVQATEPLITFRYLDQVQLKEAGSDLVRLNLLLGGPALTDEAEAMMPIACALGIATEADAAAVYRQARRTLQIRGENELAAMISLPSLSFEDHMTDLARLLGGDTQVPK